MAAALARDDLRVAVRELGLAGRPVCVHSSLRSFGQVEGGADVVIDAFLDEGCTFMVPSFTYHYSVAPPEDDHPERNAMDYADHALPVPDVSRFFTPDTSEISRADMGAIPAAVVARRGRSRGAHPLNSFSALGPLAEELTRDQTAIDVYAPFQRLAEKDGAVVMMGVALDTMTLLHYAEQMAGRALFIRWAVRPSGEVIRVRGGGCSNGFPNFDGVLSPVEQRTTVGESVWRVFPARETLSLASNAIAVDPMVTHCGRADCERCRDAVLGGPIGRAILQRPPITRG